jgi:hypothetical protein
LRKFGAIWPILSPEKAIFQPHPAAKQPDNADYVNNADDANGLKNYTYAVL